MKTHFLNHIDNPIQGFCITKIGYKNEYDFSVYHRHDYYEVFLFETGSSGLQNIDFVEYKIKKHHLYFVTPGQVHLLNRHKDEKGYLIQFTREFLNISMAPSKVNITNLLQNNNGFALTRQQFSFIECIIKQLEDNDGLDSPFKHQKITKLFAFFMFSLIEHFPSHSLINTTSSLVQSFFNLVKKEIRQHRQVSYYANKLNTSPNKLAKETKQQYGLSPLKIIHRELILEIKRQLIFEDKSHKELAFFFYFDDLSTYSRFIKGQTGLNPTELKSNLMKIVNSLV